MIDCHEEMLYSHQGLKRDYYDSRSLTHWTRRCSRHSDSVIVHKLDYILYYASSSIAC